MPKAEKIERVAELKAGIEGSDALLLTEYRGLTVSDITELRRSLAEGGARFAVVKNTLMQRAAADASIEDLESMLEGPTAVAFVAGDPVAAAKKVVEAAKKFPALILKGGYMEGKVLSADEAKGLADLDSKRGHALEDRGAAEGRDVPRRIHVRLGAVEVPVAARGIQGEGARRLRRRGDRAGHGRGRAASRSEAPAEPAQRQRQSAEPPSRSRRGGRRRTRQRRPDADAQPDAEGEE